MALFTLLVFANTLGGGFFLDDETIYLEDPHILQGTLKSAFSSDLPAYIPRSHGYHYYRPLGTLTHIVLYRLFGPEPFALHLFSVAAHAAVTVLAFLLLLELVELPVACMAAALFSVHPLHVEPVAWMASVPEVLAGGLVLLSLLALLRARRGPRRWLAVSYIAAAAALLMKETSLALPVLAALFAGWQAWPFFAIAAAWFLLRTMTLGFAAAPLPPLSVFGALRGVAAAAAHHAGKLAFPWDLAVEYELAPSAWDWAILAILLGGGAWLARRHRLARLSLLLVMVPLLPALVLSPLLPGMRQVQDRHAYVAILGVALLLGQAFRRRAGALAAAALLVLWSALSAAGAFRWRDSEAVWLQTLRVTPSSRNAVLGLGDWYYSTGRFADAERIYNQGLKLHPGDRDFLYSRAMIRKKMAPPAGGGTPIRY